jgi:hypothetical protein
MKLKLISCEVFYREMCSVVARSPHQVDAEFLPKGLHDVGSAKMRQRLQDAIDQAGATDYEAVLLGYALCNNGIHKLEARRRPLVVPRAHDCIAIFFGSRKRYADYFVENPGTYYRTTDWIERRENLDELKQISIMRQAGLDNSFGELVEKYGEDNALYIYEQLYQNTRHYNQLTFIEMGVEPDGSFEQQAREEAKERDWTFEKEPGDINLLQRLVNGDWDGDDFLVVEPSHRIMAKYHEGVIESEPIVADA